MNIDGYPGRMELTLKTVVKGNPQGNVLSPFLWNLVIDCGLRYIFPEGVKILAFADDIVLFTESKHLIKVTRGMQISEFEWYNSTLL